MQYDERILHALLDTYENSLLSRGENKVAVHISFPVTKKTLPAYFDESSLAYEKIHGELKELEQRGYLRIVWKKGKENHIVQKVVLCDEHAQEVYEYLGRTPIEVLRQKQLQALQGLAGECRTPIAESFLSWLLQRLQQGKSVKEYLELQDLEETIVLIRAIGRIEENQEEIYIREFSVKCFGDTKLLEKHLGVLGKIFRRFSHIWEDMEIYDILAEYGIYHTPNYVYMKGNGSFSIGEGEPEPVKLQKLKQGIGISGEDLDTLSWTDLSSVRRVITIENLTTFFRWKEEHSILIYLGGYHNAVRRKLLKGIYEAIPQAEYLHFGDIDAGGFQIYRDLCVKTGIPFQPYLMGIEQLKQYAACTKKLSENDRKRIHILKEKEEFSNVADVLTYMEREGVKLEQECIQWEEKGAKKWQGMY